MMRCPINSMVIFHSYVSHYQRIMIAALFQAWEGKGENRGEISLIRSLDILCGYPGYDPFPTINSKRSNPLKISLWHQLVKKVCGLGGSLGGLLMANVMDGARKIQAVYLNIPGFLQFFSMAISGTDSLEVPTIYKAYVSGLNFREYPHKIWPYMV